MKMKMKRKCLNWQCPQSTCPWTSESQFAKAKHIQSNITSLYDMFVYNEKDNLKF